ncbi:MAG: helix-turn-helix domain-containing protein [Chloroflexota bacterium]
MTQAELAARMQVAGFDLDRAGIAKIESRLREVDDRELVALASALGVSAAWLLGEGVRDIRNG